MNVPDELNQSSETHKVAHFMEVLGLLLLILLVGWFVFSVLPSVKKPSTEGTVGVSAATKEEAIEQMSTRASETTVVSAVEKKEMFDQMSQLTPAAKKASSTGGEQVAGASASPQVVPVSAVSPAEKQKMFNDMLKKAQ